MIVYANLLGARLRYAGDRNECLPIVLQVESREPTVEAREWIERAAALERELGRLEGRMELTAITESTLREQLLRERERAERLEAERDRLLPDLLRQKDLSNAERERAEHFEAQLREALQARRGWLRRFFGI